MEKMRSITKTICLIILSLILTYSIVIMFQSILFPNETPSFFGLKTYIVASGSMEPTLKIGDIVVIKDIERDALKEGDIISFRQNQGIVTHRINSMMMSDNTIMYQTKGDNNNICDKKMINSEDIEGKLVFKIPVLGKVLIFFQKNNVVLLTLVIINIVVLFKSKEKIK